MLINFNLYSQLKYYSMGIFMHLEKKSKDDDEKRKKTIKIVTVEILFIFEH